MRVVWVGSGISLIIAVASCATVSGLADYGVVDCPGGCPDVDGPDGSIASDSGPGTDSSEPPVDAGPPACDPKTDVKCMQLPSGWTLAARAPIGNGAPVACPAGMSTQTIVQESPTIGQNGCECANCSVTSPATCNGLVAHATGTNANGCPTAGSTSFFKDPMVGTCYGDVPSGPFTEANKFTLPAAQGGACNAGAVTAHPERASFGPRSELCDDTSRCSGGFCNAEIAAPFATCVVRSGDQACPAGFGDKHVVGADGAALDCGACTCNVVRAACTGSVVLYNDPMCLFGGTSVPANGTCGGPDTEFDGFASYKVNATSSTTCTSTAPAPLNVRMKNARTVCCR